MHRLFRYSICIAALLGVLLLGGCESAPGPGDATDGSANPSGRVFQSDPNRPYPGLTRGNPPETPPSPPAAPAAPPARITPAAPAIPAPVEPAPALADPRIAGRLVDDASRRVLKLSNGFTVILQQNRTAPVVAARIYVKAGSLQPPTIVVMSPGKQ